MVPSCWLLAVKWFHVAGDPHAIARVSADRPILSGTRGATMKQIPNYGDQRQLAFCTYCGGPPDTRDHVPSRVLLDEPYPANLPAVGCCDACNSGASSDEEYVACIIDCAASGWAIDQTTPGCGRRSVPPWRGNRRCELG